MLASLPQNNDPNVLVGFDTSDDAGVYLLNDEQALVFTADFITPPVDDPYLFGQIAGLTQINWASSYFHLWPNIASVFATFVPLEYSPLVTVYFALIVKLYLFLFIIFGKSNFAKSNVDKFFLTFIVLLSPPMVSEVWLNTLVSQVYFTIICIFVLFQKNDTGSIFNKSSPFILLISSLTSLLPCLLTPFFLFNFIRKKNKLNLYNFVSILIGSVFQFFIFSYSYLQNFLFAL